MKSPFRRTLAGTITIVTLCAAGCGDDEQAIETGTQPPATESPTTESPMTSTPPTTAQPTATPPSGSLDEPDATELPPLFDGSPEVVAGTYVADGFGVPFEITIAEDGWSEFDGFALVKADEGFVSFWSPTHVPGDACGWQATNGEVAEQLLIGWSHTSTRRHFPEVETMLVMDLDGERAVFIAGSFAAPSAALEEELSAILDSIHFVPNG